LHGRMTDTSWMNPIAASDGSPGPLRPRSPRSRLQAVVGAFMLAGGLATAGALAAGCATTASAGYSGSAELVYVSPGVQVIADWDEPIFYADGYYWRSSAGVWYRSSYYTGGWVYSRPPGVILSIHSPHAYRHYRPHGWAPRGHAAPIVRGAPPPRAAPPPPSHGPFAPGMRAAPPPMHAGPPVQGPGRPGPAPHGGPPSGGRARAPFMGRGGPHR
jgi:hypothetical protein